MFPAAVKHAARGPPTSRTRGQIPCGGTPTLLRQLPHSPDMTPCSCLLMSSSKSVSNLEVERGRRLQEEAKPRSCCCLAPGRSTSMTLIPHAHHGKRAQGQARHSRPTSNFSTLSQMPRNPPMPSYRPGLRLTYACPRSLPSRSLKQKCALLEEELISTTHRPSTRLSTREPNHAMSHSSIK